MICKNCNHKNNNSNIKCDKCGKPLHRKNSTLILSISLAVLVVFAVAGSFFLKDKPKNDKNGENPAVPTTPATSDTALYPLEEDNIPKFEPDLTKSESDIDAILDNVLVAANKYYDDYWEIKAYLTRNGYLYDFSTSDYVRLNDLIKLTDIKNEYLTEKAYILYIKPQDFSRIVGVPAKSSNKTFEIFVSYEVKDGFIVKSNFAEKTLVSHEKYNQILEFYKTDNSRNIKINKDNPKYKKVVKALSNIPDAKDGFDFRNIVLTDKYALVIASPVGKTIDVRGYILENKNDDYEIAFSDFQNYIRFKNEVNDNVINFNINILPKYNLQNYRKLMITDFTIFDDNLKKLGLTDDSDGKPTFTSGAGLFVFLEYKKTGKNFVGYFNREEKTWEMNPVRNYEDAAILMATLEVNDVPYFILKNDFNY